MSLTGTPFFILTIALVVLAIVGMVVGWNRVPGPTAVRIAVRVFMTVLSQAVAVLMVLVYVNNSMGPFYDSWGSLFGQNAEVQLSAGGSSSGDQSGGSSVNGASAQKLSFTTYTDDVLITKAVGPDSHIKANMLVWLPPQYNDPAYAHTDFPVVELLPGTPGVAKAWFGSMKAHQEMKRLMADGKVKPMILVSAEMNMYAGPEDSGCANLPGSYQTATWLAKDVPALVKQNFRASADPKHWAIMGYSSGGYCAANLGVQYPQVYHAIVSMSGYATPEAPVVLKDPQLAAANNPLELLKQARQQPNVVIMATGTLTDGSTVPDAKALVGALHTPGPSQVMTLDKGDHLTSTFIKMLPGSLTWISQQIAG
ncbi:alpha/beta hydrolase [Streptacidiphilus sp. EB129]|uniref:alpha/beta hydrolase n=1 Tax=Streptacidiphilus sp. EB129 TaxID=3156262 RepID=UPI003516F5A6